VQTISTQTEIEALLLESQLIKRYLPVGNSQQRDEVHYPFVRIDVASAYPRIELTRFPQDDDAIYIGPFRSARAVGHVVEYVRAVCGIRTCDRPALPDGRACLLLDLKKCLGPCVGAVSSEEYRSAVERAVEMLNGDWEDITRGLEERMQRLADLEEFERAAELRDAVEQLRRLMDPQRRLADLAHFHAVVITDPGKPSTPGSEGAPSSLTSSGRGGTSTADVQLFCIRGGLLVRQTRLDWPADRRRLGPLVRAAYQGEEPVTMTPAAAAEATTVAGWLRQQQKRAGTVVVEVDPRQPAGALAEIRAVLDRRAGPSA
jgi:hypothetical protein